MGLFLQVYNFVDIICIRYSVHNVWPIVTGLMNNLEGTQPVVDTGWLVKIEHAHCTVSGDFRTNQKPVTVHQADHATSTGLPHDEP